MPRSRIGLDIGSTSVRAAEVVPGDVPIVLRAAQVPLPPGAVENGEVRQAELVGEALRDLWKRAGFRGRQVHLGVGNQRVIVREATLPWLPEKELRASLGFQVQELIPMAVEEAVLDFDVLGEVEQGGRRMVRIMLVAAHKGMIDVLVLAAAAGRLQPVSIDLSPFAVVRAVGTADEGLDLESHGDEAILDVGAHITTVCVHDRGTTRFVRILPSGGRDITLAIARGLGLEDDVAEQLKRGQPVEGAADLEDVRRVALSRAGAFVDEVRFSLEFYAAQVPGARIGRVLFVGGGSKLEGFAELLQERIPVPVERGHVFEKTKSELDLSSEAMAEAEPVLATAVGLAIPYRRPA